VSYALRLAGDAVADLRALPATLAEEVLDELESLVEEPIRLRLSADQEAVWDMDRRVGEVRHIVFIRLHCDRQNKKLTVLAIVDHQRPWLRFSP